MNRRPMVQPRPAIPVSAHHPHTINMSEWPMANGEGCDSEMDVMALRADHLGKARTIMAERQGFGQGRAHPILALEKTGSGCPCAAW